MLWKRMQCGGFFMQKQSNRKKCRIIAGVILLAIIVGCIFYVSDYYRALPEALSAVADPSEGVTVTEEKNHRIVFEPENAKVGMIFYPGGKVQYEAYAPLMEGLAKEGILCVLLHMPANLAVLDMNAAEGIVEEYPEIESWYIGGHSLGGSMAASYAAKNIEELDGVILLASYSTAALQDSSLNVVSVYGSNDQILNLDKYDEYRENLPKNFCEEVIDGGNHAYFGAYGLQEGDGEPQITNNVQIQTAVDIIVKEIQEK